MEFPSKNTTFSANITHQLQRSKSHLLLTSQTVSTLEKRKWCCRLLMTPECTLSGLSALRSMKCEMRRLRLLRYDASEVSISNRLCGCQHKQHGDRIGSTKCHTDQQSRKLAQKVHGKGYGIMDVTSCSLTSLSCSSFKMPLSTTCKRRSESFQLAAYCTRCWAAYHKSPSP